MILFIFSQFFLAESLFFNKQYDLALIEYKRLFFFDSTSYKNLQLRLHYTITLLYKDFFSGYEETQKLLNDFSNIDSESRMLLAKELINTENYSLAIDILKPISEDNLLKKRLTGYGYLFNHQYYNALREFKNTDKNLTTEIERYIKMPRKSLTRAMLLSVIFPGMGEVYAGDIKSGVQDFILTFLSGFLMYNSIKNKEYVDAGIIFSFAFNRFYFGSISNAGRIAYKRNEQSEKKFLEKIKVEYYQKDLDY
ncbi:MAG: hypothetical protein ABIL69_04815 [candidate division WOR-3 bacterium]